MKTATPPSLMGRFGAALRALGGATDPYDRWFSDAPDDLSRLDRATRPYSQVSAVYNCVKKRSTALSQLPLMVSTREDEVLESGAVVEITEQPNPMMTRRKFWRATLSYYDLSGGVVWWFGAMGDNERSRVTSVWPFPIARFRKRVERDRHVGWWFRTSGGGEIEVGLDEVHVVIDPDYERGGDVALSPKDAVQLAVQQFYKGDRANLSALDNDMDFGGMMTTEGNLTVDQRRAFRQELQQKHAGVMNRKRMLIAEGGMDFKQIQAAFKEMEFSELKKMSRVEICASYGIPPAVVGYYEDSNYSHSDSAHEVFWVDTMLSMAEFFAEEWTCHVLPRFGEVPREEATTRRADHGQLGMATLKRARQRAAGTNATIFAWFDPADVPAVQKARLAVVEQAEKWNKMGVPLNSILRATDAPFEEVAWGDTWWKPMAQVDVQEAGEGLAPPDGDGPEDLLPQEPVGEDPEAAPERARAGGRQPVGEMATRVLSDRQLDRIHTIWWQSHAPLRREMRGKVRRHFNGLRNQVVARLRENADAVPVAPEQGRAAPAVVARDLIGQIVFDVVAADSQLTALVGPLVRESLRLGGEQAMADAADAAGQDEPDPFEVEGAQARAAIRRRQIKLRGINDTMAQQLRGELAEGMAAGESIAELTDRVQGRFDVARSRATTIARTETAAAVEEGQGLGRQQAGIPMKSWLWSRKENGRPGHAAAERKTLSEPIERGEKFELANPSTGALYLVDHPRDASLPAGEVINCGCTTMSRFPEDDVRDARMLGGIAERGPLTYEALSKRTQNTPDGKEPDDA